MSVKYRARIKWGSVGSFRTAKIFEIRTSELALDVLNERSHHKKRSQTKTCSYDSAKEGVPMINLSDS
jgi:hypothetical protein